jgi:SulP family sulfate permease
MLHAVFLLAFMLIAAPLAGFIPLAALAGVLAVVAWNMAEKHEFATLLRASWGDAVVLLATFLLTIFVDLTTGIVAGFSIGALLFLHRMAQTVEVQSGISGEESDEGYAPELTSDPDIAICKISGAFFFGAAAAVGAALEEIGEHPRAYVLDLSEAPMLDSSAAAAIGAFTRNAGRRGAIVIVAGARSQVHRTLMASGVRSPLAQFKANVPRAVEAARQALAPPKGAAA